MRIPEKYWETEMVALLKQLETTASGLSGKEAASRLKIFGHNILKKKTKESAFSLLIYQFKSPIIIILIFASAVSAFLRELTDTAIILAIIIVSGFLSFIQEYRASKVVDKLLKTVKTKEDMVKVTNLI